MRIRKPLVNQLADALKRETAAERSQRRADLLAYGKTMSSMLRSSRNDAVGKRDEGNKKAETVKI